MQASKQNSYLQQMQVIGKFSKMPTQWVIPKDSLETVISLIDNVPARNGVQSSDFIKISKAGKDGATFMLSSSLYGKALIRTGEQFPFENDLFLDRRLFIPFVNGGKESKSTDYIFAETNNNGLAVKHGNRLALYSHAHPISGYEEPKDLDKAMSIGVGKKWTAMIDAASTCATDDPIVPSLNCVYITQTDNVTEAMASNERLVFYGKVPTDKKLKGAIAFPLGLVASLREEGATKLHWTDKMALVEFPKGKLWSAVKSAARKNFPHTTVREHIEKMKKESMICSVSSSVFARAAERLSGYTAALDKEDLSLDIHLTKGSKKVKLKAGVADSRFTEMFHSITEAEEDVVLEWPLAAVMPVVMFSKDDSNFRIHLAKSGTSSLVSKNVTLLIGARTKDAKKKKSK